MLSPTDDTVVLLWTLDLEVRDGRMVTGLLHVDHGSILSHGLVRFTKNRVQGLIPDILLEEVADVVRHQ